MSRENVEVVRRFYELYNRGDFEGTDGAALVVELFDPDVVIDQLDEVAGTKGTFQGYEGMLQAQREVTEVLADVRFLPEEHAAAGDRVAFVVRAEGTGRESGVPVDTRLGHVWSLRAGRIARWVVYRDPGEALEAVRAPG